MRISAALTSVLLLCGSAAGARDLEPLLERPITLQRGAVDLTVHGTYTNWSSGSASGGGPAALGGETLTLGVDFGATDRIQLGIATALPIEPGAAFGSIVGGVAFAVGSRSALRIDAGFENFGVNGGNTSGFASTHTNRFFGGVGAPIRVPIGPTLAFVTGRTGAIEFGHFRNIGDRGMGLYIGASDLTEGAADFFVLSGGDNDSGTNIGINLPAGLLIQPDPHFALTLHAGYSTVIAIPSAGGDAVALHFIPVGLDAVVTPVPALDVGGRFFLDGYFARSGGTGTTNLSYFDLRAVLLWIRVRV
jgi:hypothetical protein